MQTVSKRGHLIGGEGGVEGHVPGVSGGWLTLVTSRDVNEAQSALELCRYGMEMSTVQTLPATGFAMGESESGKPSGARCRA